MSAEQPAEDKMQRAEQLARLAVVCRHISGMMEAGVDILRITRVVRSQTEDEDILRLCERIDYDLKRGRAISDALEDEPDLFSRFAVTLVRQGEERSNLTQAFARVAQALDTERQELLESLSQSHTPTETAPETPQVLAAPIGSTMRPSASQPAERSAWADASWLERAEARWMRAATGIGAGLLAASAASEALVALGIVPAKYLRPLSRAMSAGVLAAAALSSHKITPETAAKTTETPQVLEASAQAPAQDTALDELAPPHPSAALPQQSAVPMAAQAREAAEETPASQAVYTGAPRDDEEEARRTVRRPRDEEEFD